MAEFDTVIMNGTIVDGTRLPRFRGDLGIKDGCVAEVGRLKAHQGHKVIDASGLIVAPGFVDLHTHYDAQLFWDPYCTVSGWHGVTSVAIGNCGFGFAPVAPGGRDRSMLTMTRNEAIPLESMRAGMPWDWVTFPEYLDSLQRHPKSVNVLPLVPVAPMLTWVMGLEEAKTGRRLTADEERQMRQLLNESMDAGGCGWSVQRLGRNSLQMDYDGTPMVTDVMAEATLLALGRMLGERRQGYIQMTYFPDSQQEDSGWDSEQYSAFGFYEKLAEVCNRPIIYNSVIANDRHTEMHRDQLRWLNSCRERGLWIYSMAAVGETGFVFTFKDWNLYDDAPPWREATVGGTEERLQKLSDPARRPSLKATESGITLSWDKLFIIRVKQPEFKQYENMSIVEAGRMMGKHPVDAMLDIAVADALDTEFQSAPVNHDFEHFKEVAEWEPGIWGVSDGGAHTKFFTGGVYPTEALVKIRDHGFFMNLETAHWHLSTAPALCAGFKGRGTLVQGASADIAIYDLDRLALKPMEIAYDFPGGEWRRIQRAQGYRKVLVNGEVTVDDDQPTDVPSGRLLRHGR